ncbi:MAG TPA: glycosyltransferase family 39 protein, partial [Candidatus Polarisedimenticolia bacterium]|nr:glycosyltransferase family 39 protein [Candidatus Polarisedimenticolia bacterium]
VLLTSLEYALMARVAVTDMTLTLAITLVMLAAARYLEEGRASQAALAGAAAGLALLTKGPVGALLPGVALLVYALLARRTDLVRRHALAAATAGALLTAGPWYLYMALRHRDLLVGTFLGQGNLGRFLQPEHPAFPLYYAVIFAFGLLPWSGALPAALYEALRPAVWRDERGVGRRPGPLYLVCWFAAAPLVFSLSASKLPSYILPSFPPAALLIAHYWSRALSFEEGVGRGRGARLAALLGVLLATVTAAGLALFSRRPAWLEARAPLLAIGALLLAASLAALAAAWHRRPAWLLVSQPVAAIGALLILVTLVYPRAEPYVSVRPLALDLRRQGIEREVRGAYHVSDVGLDFYFGRDLPRVSDPAALRRLLAEAPPGGVWIVRSRDLAELEADPDLAARAVSRGPYRSAVRFGNATGAAGEGS